LQFKMNRIDECVHEDFFALKRNSHSSGSAA
jgi:hypothetical protein